MASIQQEWFTRRAKPVESRCPAGRNVAYASSAFNLLAQLARTGKDVERELCVLVLVWWLPPRKPLMVLAADFHEDGDRTLENGERIPIDYVYLAAAARLPAVLLKRGFEDDRAEADTREAICVERFPQPFGVHPRRADQFKGPCSASPL